MSVMTVMEVLTASTDFLKRKSVENPRLNAEHLVAGALGCRRLDLYIRFDEPLDQAVINRLRDQVRRRGAGEPLQHLLGTVEFLGRTFLCDKRALIPRPETELLVEKTIARLRGLDNVPRRLADIGTGSGVIAISLALELPDWEVCANEPDAQALALAGENAERLQAPVKFGGGSFYDGLCSNGERLGAVIANLPYIPTPEIAGLSIEVRHDPIRALDGGADGLELIRELIRRSPVVLAPGGLIALEIGAGQAADVATALGAEKFQDIAVEQDYQGIERFLFATAPAGGSSRESQS